MKKLLWWLFAGKGGVSRARIINKLNERPYNAHQIAEELNLDYKTIRHHLNILEKNKIITSSGEKYGMMYFLSDGMEKNYFIFKEIWNSLNKNKEGI